MQNDYHYYLIRLQYLGFRFHGWQKQPNQKTVEGMVHKTLKFILPNRTFKILASGRTDSKVSALDAAFELFLEGEPLGDKSDFINLFNLNLPSDIKVISVINVDKNFNVINNAKIKEYVYFFSFGEKNHPFCAPFLTNVQEQLNLELMQHAAQLFVGEHDFTSFTVKSAKDKDLIRNIVACEIKENTLIAANFFPEQSYALHISATGFVRYQVRMIMGALIQLGKGEIEIELIEAALKPNSDISMTYVAPGSGLMLKELNFE